MKEIARTLKPSGTCIMVAQDSYYKNVHNDLPGILTQMAENQGLELLRREDFKLTRSMAQLNVEARRYRHTVDATEAVLCFGKN